MGCNGHGCIWVVGTCTIREKVKTRWKGIERRCRSIGPERPVCAKKKIRSKFSGRDCMTREEESGWIDYLSLKRKKWMDGLEMQCKRRQLERKVYYLEWFFSLTLMSFTTCVRWDEGRKKREVSEWVFRINGSRSTLFSLTKGKRDARYWQEKKTNTAALCIPRYEKHMKGKERMRMKRENQDTKRAAAMQIQDTYSKHHRAKRRQEQPAPGP